YNDKLKTVIFQEEIGTIFEKTEHIQQISKVLLEKLRVDQKTYNQTMRAAEICKFDLMTDMVNEFTELEGIMGEKYAVYFGENDLTAKAIREHYLPLSAKGVLPETTVGAVVAVADKLDTIVGCF